MLFSSVDLAARIERAERRLVEAAVDATGRLHPGEDVYLRIAAGGAAAHVREGSPLNKFIGLGFEGPLGESALVEIERVFAERGAPLQVELSTLADPSLALLLTGRGYSLVGFENVLGRDIANASAAELPAGVSVRRIDAAAEEELGPWLDVVIDGFAHPDTGGVPAHESFPRDVLEASMRDMAGTEGFVLFQAEFDGRTAGGASMFVAGDVVNLCGAATAPALRRRGVQTALLAERLRLARADGARVAVVTTQPGSKSQENVQRQGFSLLYTRAILVRTPDAPS